MTWKEYLPLAEKTLSSEFYCDEFYQKILHSVMGTLTEVEEILEVYKEGDLIQELNKQGSVAEEAADIFWYISILFRELNIVDPNENIEPNMDELSTPYSTIISLLRVNLKFLDLLKKKIYYNKPVGKEIMINHSKMMYFILNHYCGFYSIDVENILEKNIEKLRARYGDKFTVEKAINRNTEIERQILEK